MHTQRFEKVMHWNLLVVILNRAGLTIYSKYNIKPLLNFGLFIEKPCLLNLIQVGLKFTETKKCFIISIQFSKS